MEKRCITSFTIEQLTALMKELGQPGFRAKQIESEGVTTNGR